MDWGELMGQVEYRVNAEEEVVLIWKSADDSLAAHDFVLKLDLPDHAQPGEQRVLVKALWVTRDGLGELGGPGGVVLVSGELRVTHF